jgi:hypothetical protein
MMGRFTASRRAWSTALLCAVAVGAAAPADAGGVTDKLRDGLFKNRGGDTSAAPLARYVSEEGRAFTLDRTQPVPMLKFEDSPEVWVLLPSPAPRGDVIYKNDLGEPMLRATRLGGFTLFTDDRPNGEAVSLAGAGAPLRLSQIGPQALADRLLQASYRSGRAARHPIGFQAEASPASAALMADAAVVVTLALYRLAEAAGGRPVGRFNLVLFEEGKKPAAMLKDNILRIVVAPAQGLAGRPSSKRIMKAVGGK